MLKKTTAILLAAVMLFATLCVPAYAIDFGSVKQSVSAENSRLKKAVSKAAAKLIGSNGKASVSDALFEAIAEKAGPEATESAVSEAMSDYAVFEVSNLPDTAQRIAESAEYKIRKGNVVYIVIDLDKNPELLDAITLCETARALYESQNAFIKESGKEGLKANTYVHIIGELALHCAVYVLAKAAGGEKKGNPLNFLYESARVTELNQDEMRGFVLIYLVGFLLSEYYDSKA